MFIPGSIPYNEALAVKINLKMKSVNIYIIAASILLIDNLKCVTGQSCEPRTKSPDLSEIAKFMNDLKSSKWNERTPTSDELFEEVQFWCIEPLVDSFHGRTI